MRILAAWDQPDQMELLWDVVLMSIALPDVDRGFEVLTYFRRSLPDTPVVGVCQPLEVYRIIRFMTNGMSAYMIRDTNNDYLFMLLNVLETTVEAARAAREQKVFERLREEIDAVRASCRSR